MDFRVAFLDEARRIPEESPSCSNCILWANHWSPYSGISFLARQCYPAQDQNKEDGSSDDAWSNSNFPNGRHEVEHILL
jgi:hypothetical protein